VLAGPEDPRDTFLNPLDWYAENGVTLRAGSRVRSTGAPTLSAPMTAHEYDQVILATGSYTWVPPIDNLTQDNPNTAILKPARSGSPPSRTATRCSRGLGMSTTCSKRSTPPPQTQFATT